VASMGAEIKQLREERGISIQEAKRIVLKRNLREDIAAARTVEELQPILLILLDNIIPQEAY